jgi:lipoyl(octanoyl) transferase
MNITHQPWRLIITLPASGAWNMAVDEALLEAVGQGVSLPCLRLYSWYPPCLSIGYAQPAGDIDRKRLLDLDWDWVRRPTGGRAILHTDELTYSVVASASEPRLSGGVLESYQRLSKALLSALHILGIPAQAHPIHQTNLNQADAVVCFEVPSNYEIVVDGKKLIGSAQARRKEGILQHGTLPLQGDLTRITQVLVFPDDRAREEASLRLLSHATTVETVLAHQISWDAAAHAFIEAFESELDLELEPGELSIIEKTRADQLVQDKYCHLSWLERI